MYNLWLVWSLGIFSMLICLSFIIKSVIPQTYVFRVITSNCKLLNLSHTTSLKACKNISEKNRSLKSQEFCIAFSPSYPNNNTLLISSPLQTGWREAKPTGKHKIYSVIIIHREF
jgi:hypothetical protein